MKYYMIDGVLHGFEDGQELPDKPMTEVDFDFVLRFTNKPSQFHVWDEGNLKWIDPRTDEEIALATRQSMPRLNQRQFRKILRDNGIFEQARDFVYSSGNGYMEDAWEYSEFFDRLDPLLVLAMNGLGLTDEQVDAMWE